MNGRKTSTRHSAQALTLFCALALPACGWSNTIACVTNNSQLVTALNEVQFTPLTIKVATGNYDLKNTFWHGQLSNGFYTYTSASQLAQISSGSEILGGYNNDCSTRSIAVGNTTFTDSGITDSIVDDGAFPLGDFTLEGVTWSVRNGVWLLSGFAPFNAKTGSMVLLRRNAFINAPNNGPNILWEQTDDGGSIVRIVENLFASNAIGSHCALSVEATGGSPAVQVINNTVVDNSGSGARGACFDNVNYPPEGTSGNATYYIYNNIFFGSGSKDLEILDENRTTQLALLYDNVVGSRVAGTSPEFETNTQTGDPKLDGNYQPIQAPVSPVINTGNNSVPGGLPSVDLAGQPRLVGSRVDRGAYESTVDFSNVQMVSKHGFDDGSAGTLSAAVANINTNNGGSIKFNITDGGACPWVITLGDELDIAANATINGYSQIGSSTNDLDPGDDAKLCIIVEAGTGAMPPKRGMVVTSAVDDGESVTIRGLAFSGFSTVGVDLQGGSQHSVLGNHFGGNVGGHAMVANGFDIRLGPSTHDDTIGSTDYADRNIVGGATGSGIVVADGSTNNQIVDNYIGLGWTTAGSGSYTPRGNGARGIYLAGDNNSISYNVIGFNAQAGIVLDSLGAHNNLISSNYIGADIQSTNFGNVGAGIHLIGDSGGVGDAPNNNTIRFNTIADNGAQGVLIDVGQGNRVRKNSIYGNAAFGLDLDAVGVTGNDDDSQLQPPDEANLDRNFPVLTSAAGGYQNGTVSGTLPTLHGDYTVDFYDSPACGNRDSESWVGSASVTVPGSGENTATMTNVPITAALFYPLLNGSKITATATDSNGNTSEFSACQNYVNDTLFTDGFDGPLPTI